MEDILWWKMTFVGKQPLREDNPWLKIDILLQQNRKKKNATYTLKSSGVWLWRPLAISYVADALTA